MTNATKLQRVMLALMLLTVVCGAGYTLYQHYAAQRALEENIEYQMLTAIEAQHPKVYVISVTHEEGAVLIYLIPPQEEQPEGYGEQFLIDTITLLYQTYPSAQNYHILLTNVIDADVFEGEVHVGIAYLGFGFTNYAAKTIALNDNPAQYMEPLFTQGEIGRYPPAQFGVHVVSEPTPRERGHIPPWAEVTEE